MYHLSTLPFSLIIFHLKMCHHLILSIFLSQKSHQNKKKGVDRKQIQLFIFIVQIKSKKINLQTSQKSQIVDYY